MAESIGTVRVDIIGNAEDLKVEVQRAKGLVASMGPEFEKSFQKMNASQKNATLAALKFEQQIGKSREEVRLLSLAARGAAPEALERVRQKLLQTRDAGDGMAKTSKEMQFAMRGLPAQITDIFTSLAAGQNPMMVFLQQGGQLKDQFGGIRPAAQALGGAIVGLINPLTVTATAVGVLALAWHQAESEMVAFNKALITTGNFAGVTAGELAELSAVMQSSVTTQSDAAHALAEVAKSGKFTADQLQLVSTAALDLERSTGQSIDQTVKQFEKLKDEPVKAALELNEQYHFLAEATYEQIKALEQQGDTLGAAELAMSEYATAVGDRARDIDDSLGTLETAWRNLGAGAKWAWDRMLDVGRSDPLDEKIRELGAKIYEIENPSNMFSFAQLGPAGSEARKEAVAELKGELAELLRQQRKERRDAYQDGLAAQAADAAIALDQEAAAYATSEEKRVRRINEINEKARKAIELAEKAGGENLAERIAEIRRDAATAIAGINEKAAFGGGGSSGSVIEDEASRLAADLAFMETFYADLQVQNHNRGVDAWAQEQQVLEQRRAAVNRLLEDMQAEIEISQLSGVEKEKAIALRYANVDAASAEGQAIAEMAEQVYQAREAEAVMNGLKDATLEFAVSAASDLGNAGDAFEDFADRLKSIAIQLMAEKAVQWLFGQFMGPSAGTYTGDGTGPGSLQGFGSNIGNFMAMGVQGFADGGVIPTIHAFEGCARGKPVSFSTAGRKLGDCW